MPSGKIIKSCLLSLTFLFILSSFHAQIPLKLISGKKTYVVKEGEECNIVTVPLANDTVSSVYKIYFGYITSINDSVFTITSDGVNTVYRTKEGAKKLDRIGLDNVVVNLNIRQIEEVESFRKWFMAPAAAGWLALVSAIIVAPLVSINYKSGTLNTDRLIKVGGISFGTAAVSMTVAYGFGKHSSFINNGHKRHKRLWTIQP